MFASLFSRKARANHDLTDGLYGQIVAAARQPRFYAQWDVPDTPLGRFEMIGLHMFLFLRRVRGRGETLDAVAQDVTDIFFKEVDHSLRELGIGDTSVPKRMKKLARMYFGRLDAYEKALGEGDAAALAMALQRNVRPEAAEWPQAGELARYVLAAEAALAAESDETLLSGQVIFPDPAQLEANR
ncbi:MAG: ubiquinol-cytochrome C chaperone family protein [Zhengella sp.]|uniref:ubiquinol-cytochrome C chaperone family protein n=1 Tax=Zhengella sp. TaxID=2282762 RepID=UPI001D1C01CD|nr:ubiquinol-cytochrome C chaperone [Notoacmeibacter sp.]MCC0026609.1 ubiquinol-cytochrome C chaperone [Brucellaceae bacterium]